jgi:Bacterial Ig-like domain (group 1)
MSARRFVAATAVLLSAFVTGCSQEKSSSIEPLPPPTPVVTIVPSVTGVVANGTNTVILTVTDTGGGPVTVTANRGTFSPGGGQTATVPGASGNVTLVTCDAALAGCAGTALVTATAGTRTDSASIAFGDLATVCTANCGADIGCQTRACTPTGGGTGTCSATTPSTCISASTCSPNPIGTTSETGALCADALDNDCNGNTDGADAACEGQPCASGSPTLVWRSGACTDITAGLGIKVTPVRTRLPANGTATTTVVVEVTADGDPGANMAVSISTSFGTLSAASGTTGADGTVSFTFTSTATPGVATITAAVAAVPVVSHTATITMPRLGSFQLPAAPVQFPVMGAKGSAWNEFGSVQVQVLDDTGQPYPDGLAVRFEHRPLGGSTLGDPDAIATMVGCTVAPCIIHQGAISSGDDPPDTTGLVSTWLYSGTVAGTLGVTATVTVAGVTRTVTLPTVTVVGAKASGANFSIVCSPRNVPALAEHNCSTSVVDAPITCVAIAKDRFNNLLGTATQVIFASETAAVGQVATTTAYDPIQGPLSQADLGTATQIFNTLGAGLPFDVDPLSAAEPSIDHGLDGCGIRTHNPRDGVVTMLAIADGEEAFFDSNGNGSKDAGEPFVDQGEPFVDQDDNGQWDAGEWFLDVDGNRAYTPANGTWDAATKIWTQTVVVYTGEAATLDAGGGELLGTRFADPADFVDACVPTPFSPDFAVTASQTGPPEIAATSDARKVVASDMNLNFLNAGTKYSVDVLPDDAKLEVTYFGSAQYSDVLGLFYRYWPCDQGGNCASQCRATGAAAPCTMKPAITDFSCGLATSIRVMGGDDPERVTVRWLVDVPWTVYDGVERIQRGGASLGADVAAP